MASIESMLMVPEICKANCNMLWGWVMSEVLARLGVKQAVVAPGSRSAPLAIGFSSNEKIEAISVLDERSAGFFALGLARKSGLPVVLICSSGTAAANFYPAIIEARYSKISLIVLTADRPSEMRDCYAGQTMDQVKLYGDYPNWQVELGLPEADLEMFKYLRQTMYYARERSMYPSCGPVHVNVPFRDPLAPLGDEGFKAFQESIDFGDFFKFVRQSPKVSTLPDKDSAVTLVREMSGVERGLIVVGPSQPNDPFDYSASVGKISKALGWPVLAEGLSSLRNYAGRNPHLVTRYDLILRNPKLAKELRADGVLCIGALPTSKVLRGWLKGLGAKTWVLEASSDNVDALHREAIPVRMDALMMAKFFVHAPLKSTSYCEQWDELEVEAQKRVNEKLEGCDFLFEGKVAWLLCQYLPVDTPIFIANSMPVRDVEFFWMANNGHYEPCFNRGVNGIDGTLSTALGIAHGQNPSVLLTGDLALLHDSNGFLIKKQFKGHLTIVVINNDGGGIFENLPISQFDKVFEPYFVASQAVDIKKLALSHGVEVFVPTNWDEFIDLVSECPESGVRLIEVKTDRKRDTVYRKGIFKEMASILKK